MKITTSYCTLNIETAITEDTFKKVSNYAPDTLLLKHKNDLPYFAVGRASKGDVTPKGICFNGITADKHLYLSIDMGVLDGKTADQKKEIITDEFGVIFTNLKAVEAQVAAAMTEVNDKMAQVAADITCM